MFGLTALGVNASITGLAVTKGNDDVGTGVGQGLFHPNSFVIGYAVEGGVCATVFSGCGSSMSAVLPSDVKRDSNVSGLYSPIRNSELFIRWNDEIVFN